MKIAPPRHPRTPLSLAHSRSSMTRTSTTAMLLSPACLTFSSIVWIAYRRSTYKWRIRFYKLLQLGFRTSTGSAPARKYFENLADITMQEFLIRRWRLPCSLLIVLPDPTDLHIGSSLYTDGFLRKFKKSNSYPETSVLSDTRHLIPTTCTSPRGLY